MCYSGYDLWLLGKAYYELQMYYDSLKWLQIAESISLNDPYATTLN